MGYGRTTIRKITLAAAGDPEGKHVQRIWDAPSGTELKAWSVFISTQGKSTAVGDLDWDVLVGGGWRGPAFVKDANHVGGASQASGTITGPGELAHNLHNHVGLFPRTNDKVQRVRTQGHDPGEGGLPIVLKLENKKAEPVTVYISFVSETISGVV